ncbi:hypothetical protein RIF29_40147 [Crotalaria pallida]|uniref:Uncharacterized protein n=1 Tax=Crotalaria pallida TaxID=3830 RepID=A0AAN9E2L6_CROPI
MGKKLILKSRRERLNTHTLSLSLHCLSSLSLFYKYIDRYTCYHNHHHQHNHHHHHHHPCLSFSITVILSS